MKPPITYDFDHDQFFDAGGMIPAPHEVAEACSSHHTLVELLRKAMPNCPGALQREIRAAIDQLTIN